MKVVVTYLIPVERTEVLDIDISDNPTAEDIICEAFYTVASRTDTGKEITWDVTECKVCKEDGSVIGYFINDEPYTEESNAN